MARENKERLKKAALARRIEISRPTLDKYLTAVGAPAPDAQGAYDVEAVITWVSERSGHGGDDPKTLQGWKIEEVKLRCEKMRDELQRNRGQYISKAEAGKTIIPLMAELGELMRQKFVLELPSRYKGHDQVECQEMNEAAVDFIVKRFREGAGELIEAA